MDFIAVGIVTAFNVMVLIYKYNKEMYANLFFDIVVLISLGWLFKGSFGGLVAAMTASFLVSLALIWYKPRGTK